MVEIRRKMRACVGRVERGVSSLHDRTVGWMWCRVRTSDSWRDRSSDVPVCDAYRISARRGDPVVGAVMAGSDSGVAIVMVVVVVVVDVLLVKVKSALRWWWIEWPLRYCLS